MSPGQSAALTHDQSLDQLHAGARLESFPALGGAALLGIGVIALIVALAHLDYN